jgi:triacylglycerol esterase/lipase EstA (alpha/beta hydrolase family)
VTARPPVLDGRQVWTDRRLRRGYRVQVHAWLRGLHRLLDPDHRLLALGAEAGVLAAFERQAPPDDHRLAPPCVLALHGLVRSRDCFVPLGELLAARLPDSELVCLNYASPWASPAEHGLLLAEALAAMEPRARVDLVAFSMGALVARHALEQLARIAPERLAAFDRLVMIGPPNRGAALAEALHRLAPLAVPRAICGLARLGAGAAPLPRVPAAVIAGDAGPRFKSWWSEPNDGVIRVADTTLDGLSAHLVVPATHLYMLRHPQVLDLAAELLAQPGGGFAATEVP